MTAITLRRSDSARIGSRSGQRRSDAYPTLDASQQALDRQRRAKLRRGMHESMARNDAAITL